MLPQEVIQFLFKDKNGDNYAVASSSGTNPVINMDKGISYKFSEDLSESVDVGDKIYFSDDGSITHIVRNYKAKKKTTVTGSSSMANKSII